MTKLMKVCLGNEPPIGPEKCASTETLEKNKETLIYLCLDVGWCSKETLIGLFNC